MIEVAEIVLHEADVSWSGSDQRKRLLQKLELAGIRKFLSLNVGFRVDFLRLTERVVLSRTSVLIEFFDTLLAVLMVFYDPFRKTYCFHSMDCGGPTPTTPTNGMGTFCFFWIN